jgi:hypothetical protein
MNEYLRIFQTVTQSADEVSSHPDFSTEIHYAASELNQTVQPCVKNLKEAALQLQQSLQPSLAALEQAEAVWQSKPCIGNVATANIWVQLGELSGRELRFRNLAKKYEAEAIKQAQTTWQDKAQKLKYKWFEWDSSREKFKKDAINIFDKDKLTADLRQQIAQHTDTQTIAVTTRLKLLSEELQSSFSGRLQSCLVTLDPKSQIEISEPISQLERKVKAMTDFPEDFRQELKHYFDAPVNLLLQKSIFNITLDNFNEACQSIKNRQKILLETIFTERLKLGIQAISTLVSFYNDFLEKQERYRQESPSLRELEKAWIDQQRQQLERVQQDLEVLLKSTTE